MNVYYSKEGQQPLIQIVIPSQACLTSEIEEGCVVLERCEREREVGLSCVGVLEGVPEGVTGAEEGAADLVPVALGILEGGYGGARIGANLTAELANSNRGMLRL